jgi:hypothetical protein
VALVLRTSLLALLTWRLLLPPGVCLCQLGHPAAVLLARLLGNKLPAPEPEDENHHQHGCPASRLGPSLRPQPPDPPSPPTAAAPDHAGLGPNLAALIEEFTLADQTPPDGTIPLFLALCALRI